jgi:hypothetical protein
MVEVSRSSFERIYDLWDSEEQLSEMPFDAQLANEIPTANGSLGLEAELRLTGPTTRPDVFLKLCNHPLYIEQAEGMMCIEWPSTPRCSHRLMSNHLINRTACALHAPAAGYRSR